MRKAVKNFVILGVCLFSFTAAALAEGYNIKELTPAVQQALDGRKARHEELQSLKKKGIVGETNKGYVQLLAEGQGGQGLVDAENQDRKVIYEAIVAQNNLGKEALKTVEEVFAQERRDRALPGEKIQDASGVWQTK